MTLIFIDFYFYNIHTYKKLFFILRMQSSFYKFYKIEKNILIYFPTYTFIQEFACREVHESSGDWVIYFTNYAELCAFQEVLETLWANTKMVNQYIYQ